MQTAGLQAPLRDRRQEEAAGCVGNCGALRVIQAGGAEEELLHLQRRRCGANGGACTRWLCPPPRSAWWWQIPPPNPAPSTQMWGARTLRVFGPPAANTRLVAGGPVSFGGRHSSQPRSHHTHMQHMQQKHHQVPILNPLQQHTRSLDTPNMRQHHTQSIQQQLDMHATQQPRRVFGPPAASARLVAGGPVTLGGRD